jgi:hypothetical protein
MNKGTAELEWLQFLPIACAALLLVSLVTVLGELFDDFSTRPSDNTQSSFADNILGYSLLIFVIALGIYPSPLYKYLSYILERATI